MAGNVPVGAKIISILYYIGAVLLVILGIIMLVGAGMLGTLTQSIPLLGMLGAFGAALFIVIGIIMILMGILFFFVGKGLWKGKNWARWVAIVLAIIGIIIAIASMFSPKGIASNIVSLIINLIIGGYLLFSKGVKSAFK
jgi:uncharacterized membrane protein (DUF2068 family)